MINYPPYTYQGLPTAHQQGWICPKCGNVYAPMVQECWKCNNPNGYAPACGTGGGGGIIYTGETK